MLHWPNWRAISDIKTEDRTWTEQFELFLKSDVCPNFVKAQVEKAKLHAKNPLHDNFENEEEELIEASQQPEWMGLLKTNGKLNESNDFVYDDGGPDYDWTASDFSFSPASAKSLLRPLTTRYKKETKICKFLM